MAVSTIDPNGLNIGQIGGTRNKIINGAMTIDQRNAGAAVTQNTSGIYTLDRWQAYGAAASKFTVQRNAGSVTPPNGFTNYLGCTSSSAYTVGASEAFTVSQIVEGFNIADLNWGTASAQPVTISFWARSSLTGTFGGALQNIAQNRNYPFSYTISAANTWEKKAVTILGDTTGTWATDNTSGIRVYFSLGAGSSWSATAGAWTSSFALSATGAVSVVGTSGATFYLTGVQLEAGDTATPFEHRSYGAELALCQRYYQRVGSTFFGSVEGATAFVFQVPFLMPMRAPATITVVSGGIFNARYAGNDTNITNPTIANVTSTAENVWLQVVSSGLSNGASIIGRSQNYPTSNFLNVSAEL